MNRTAKTALVALLVVTSFTIASGATVVESNTAVQDGTPTPTPDEEDTPTPEEGEEVTVDEVGIDSLTLENVTVTNATLMNASGGDQAFSNVSADRAVVNGTLENVTMADVTIRNQSLAEAMNITGEDSTVEAENVTLTDQQINGLVVRSATVEELSEVNVTTSDEDVEIEGETVAMEVGSVTAESATVENVTVVNLQTEQAEGTPTPAPDEEEDTPTPEA